MKRGNGDSATAPLRVLSIFGTRPEAIKMAPLLRALGSADDRIVSRSCVTAQHRGLLDQVLRQFDIVPDHDLDLMTVGQSVSQVASRVLGSLERVLAVERPDWVLVQGDTTSTVAAAQAARYSGARVAHIEAGLRTFDKRQPFPEEINRRMVTGLADLHFAPTPVARANLLREGVDPATVMVTGNTGIDTLYRTVDIMRRTVDGNRWRRIPTDCRVILATAHRSENLGRPLERICRALRCIAQRYGDAVRIIFPTHPRREVWETVNGTLGGAANVWLVEPLDYEQLVRLMVRSDIVITDSGGLQEEAPALGKPVLVLRELTERPEAVSAGSARLVGTSQETIVAETTRLLEDRAAYRGMARRIEHFGDGRASQRIVAALLGDPVREWFPDYPGAPTAHAVPPLPVANHQVTP